MGARGPAKKPTALRLLEGDRSHRAPNRAEPKPHISADLPTCPDHLTGHAREEWERMAAVLHPVGLLTDADLTMFERWCVEYQVGRMAYAEWAADGFAVHLSEVQVDKDKAIVYGRATVHPSLAAMRAADAVMLTISRRFGFTPGDRASIKGPEVTDAEEARLDQPVRIGRTR